MRMDQSSGIFSDGTLISLSGLFDITTLLEPAVLHLDAYMATQSDNTVLVQNVPAQVFVYRNLRGNLQAHIDTAGILTSLHALRAEQSGIAVECNQPHLFNGFYTKVSEWTESTISALSDIALDDMVYREV